jgi:hypothetical protein
MIDEFTAAHHFTLNIAGFFSKDTGEVVES